MQVDISKQHMLFLYHRAKKGTLFNSGFRPVQETVYIIALKVNSGCVQVMKQFTLTQLYMESIKL